MQKCLMELLSEKTVVYATHQLEFLEAADLILVSYGTLVFFLKKLLLVSDLTSLIYTLW